METGSSSSSSSGDDQPGGGGGGGRKKKKARSKRRRRTMMGVPLPRGRESALYEVVSPAVYVTRVFGLGPYEYPRDNRPPRLRPSLLNCLYALFWISLYSFVVSTVLIRFSKDEENKPILGVTEKGKLILNYFVALADLVLGIARRCAFVKIWNAIHDFDINFDLDDADRPPHSKAKFWLWLTLVTSFVGWTAINQLGMSAFNETYLRNVGYMLVYVGTYVAVFKFAGMVFLLGQRFEYLGSVVRRQLRRKPVEPAALDVVMKKVENSYNHLMNTSEKLNDTYGWSLILFLFNLFIHTVCNMYFFYYWTIINPKFVMNAKIILVEFIWLLVYLIQLLILHLSCHYTSYESNRVVHLLLDWRRQAHRQNKQYDLKSTLHFINRRLNFTAAGCFNVNLGTLTTTFGHLTIYLVILLQLSSSPTEQNGEK